MSFSQCRFIFTGYIRQGKCSEVTAQICWNRRRIRNYRVNMDIFYTKIERDHFQGFKSKKRFHVTFYGGTRPSLRITVVWLWSYLYDFLCDKVCVWLLFSAVDKIEDIGPTHQPVLAFSEDVFVLDQKGSLIITASLCSQLLHLLKYSHYDQLFFTDNRFSTESWNACDSHQFQHQLSYCKRPFVTIQKWCKYW